MITGNYELPETADQDAIDWFAMGDEESLHLSYGAGIYFALNDNFIVKLDYGLANDPRDGDSGMYVGMGFNF